MATLDTTHSPGRGSALKLCLFQLLCKLTTICGWMTIGPGVRMSSMDLAFAIARRRQKDTGRLFSHPKILDAEFERVDDEIRKGSIDSKVIYEEKEERKGKTLFDLSLESDSELKNIRIPFMDGENYIDVKLAFMAELDGSNYGIAIPYDNAAAITVEHKDGSIDCLSPDLDDNEELMQIMAAQLKEHVSEDLSLRKTPRVLTISGPLENFTKNWQDDLLPKPVDTQTLLDESEEDLEFFHSFMRRELGDEEYEKALNESTDDLSEEIISLFDIPGLGDKKDDIEGMEELIDSMLKDPEDQLAEMEELFGKDLNHQGVALKLISYIFADGRAYSLVHLLKPYVLVGKCINDNEELRFELLTRDEERLVVPRLEEACKQDLEQAGLELQKLA